MTSQPAQPPVSPTLLHSGMTVTRFFDMHMVGAVFPLSAALILYGWRALLTVAIVLGSAAAAIALWRRIGARGRGLRHSQGLWLALLLALMLPAELATLLPPAPGAASLWPILPAAGVTLVILVWLLGGIGSSRVHPAVVAFLLLFAFFHTNLVPHRILHPHRLVLGDVTDAPAPAQAVRPAQRPWISSANPPATEDALWQPSAADDLTLFTSGAEQPLSAWLTLESLIRDRMPPLENLIIGGQPGPLGISSAVAVIIGGLFLLYRGLIGFRIPLLTLAAAYVAFFILPIPIVIREDRVGWYWLAMLQPGVGWPLAITFANYELLAGPLLFTAFFLATAPSVRPLARRARVIYAILLGLLAAVLQLYASVAIGPYMALLIVSVLTPLLDKWFRPRALV